MLSDVPQIANHTHLVSLDMRPVAQEVMELFTWIVFTWVCQVIDIFGIITNIINIVCFVKQGFKESVNIGFLGT